VEGDSVPEELPTVDHVQGRLNQREIPFKASSTAGAFTFVPTKGIRALQVVWDPTLGYPLAEVIDWLATYRPHDPS
jgi:hypothetical protein